MAGSYVTLGCCFIAVAAPWGDEGGEVSIVLMEGDAVVTIPAVKDGLFGVAWDGTCLVEGALCVMGFTCCVEVKRLEINCAAGLAILFGTYNHAVAPCDGLSYRHWFEDTQ